MSDTISRLNAALERRYTIERELGEGEEVPHEPAARNLYELLSGPKRLELVDSGHLPPLELRNPIIDGWLDETLGPVLR